jgi:hypothetical protein
MPDLENGMAAVEGHLNRTVDTLDVLATNQNRLDEALVTLADAQLRTQQQFRDTDERIARLVSGTQEQFRQTDARIAKLADK